MYCKESFFSDIQKMNSVGKSFFVLISVESEYMVLPERRPRKLFTEINQHRAPS